jgi:DNA-binding YbaB/EbfC family protein
MAPPAPDDEPIRPEIVPGEPSGGDPTRRDPDGGDLPGDAAPTGSFDLSSLLDSAQQLMSAQQEAAHSELVGSAGGGKVEVTVTGGGEFRRVRISPDVVDPADVALLEDLVLAALHDAMARINAAQTAALGGLDLGGLGGLLGDR